MQDRVPEVRFLLVSQSKSICMCPSVERALLRGPLREGTAEASPSKAEGEDGWALYFSFLFFRSIFHLILTLGPASPNSRVKSSKY